MSNEYPITGPTAQLDLSAHLVTNESGELVFGGDLMYDVKFPSHVNNGTFREYDLYDNLQLVINNIDLSLYISTDDAIQSMQETVLESAEASSLFEGLSEEFVIEPEHVNMMIYACGFDIEAVKVRYESDVCV